MLNDCGRPMHKQSKNFKKERGNYQKKQEPVKNTITELKQSIEMFTKDQIKQKKKSANGNSSFEIIEKSKNLNRKKNNKESLRGL